MVHKARRKFGIFHDKSSVTRMEEMDQSSAPNLAQRFKNTFSRDVQVHFVGAWCVLWFVMGTSLQLVMAYIGTQFHRSASSEARISLVQHQVRHIIFVFSGMRLRSTNAESNFFPNTSMEDLQLIPMQ